MKSLATIFQHIDKEAVQTVEFTQTHENLITESLNLAQTLTDELGRTLHVSDVIHTLQMETMRDNTHSYTEREAKFLNLSIEALYSSIDYKPKNTLTLESLEYKTPTEKVHITLESISEFAKKLWEQIVKAFKRFIEYIKSFFTGNTKKAEEIKAKAKEIIREVDKPTPVAKPANNNVSQPVTATAKVEEEEKEKEKEKDTITVPHILAALVQEAGNNPDALKIAKIIAKYIENEATVISLRIHPPTVLSRQASKFTDGFKPLNDIEDKDKELESFLKITNSYFIDFTNVNIDKKINDIEDYPVTYTSGVGMQYVFDMKKSDQGVRCSVVRDLSQYKKDKDKFNFELPKLGKVQAKIICNIVTENIDKMANLIWRLNNTCNAVRIMIERLQKSNTDIENAYIRALQNYLNVLVVMTHAVGEMHKEVIETYRAIIDYADKSIS